MRGKKTEQTQERQEEIGENRKTNIWKKGSEREDQE